MADIVDVTGDGREIGIERAVATLRDAKLVVLPTDTVYGVAADAFDPAATGRIFAAKDRDRTHPLPVLVRSQKQLPALTPSTDEAIANLVAAYWPGPLTIVVPSQPSLRWDLGRADGTVAVRMPLDDVTLEVIRQVGPLAVTSANRHGHPAAQDAQDAHAQLGDAVELYLDDGVRTGGVPSTIIDCTRREPHVLREGVIAATEALAVARGELDPMAITPPPPPPPTRGGDPEGPRG